MGMEVSIFNQVSATTDKSGGKRKINDPVLKARGHRAQSAQYNNYFRPTQRNYDIQAQYAIPNNLAEAQPLRICQLVLKYVIYYLFLFC